MPENDRDYGASVEFAIFDNDFKSGKQPDRRGQIEMSNALLKEMVEAGRAGRQPILGLAVWNNTSKKDKKYLYCRLQMDTYAMDKAEKGSTTPEGGPEGGGETTSTDESDKQEDDPF